MSRETTGRNVRVGDDARNAAVATSYLTLLLRSGVARENGVAAGTPAKGSQVA
jgi:hypothetical protein